MECVKFFFLKYCLFWCFFICCFFFINVNFTMVGWGNVSPCSFKKYQQLQLTFTVFLNHKILKVYLMVT